MKKILLMAILPMLLWGQQYTPPSGGSGSLPNVTSLPVTCTPTGSPNVVFLTTGTVGVYMCDSTNHWSYLGGSTSSGSILNGTVDPTSSDGTDGSFWITTTTNCLWGPKASGSWPATCTSLVGPAGASGPQGPTGAPGVPGYSPNAIISGCGVAWTTGYVFRVASCRYNIAGQTYTASEASTTLSSADPTNDRIDVLYVDVSGSVGHLTGSPSATPAPPTVDSSTQLQLSFVYVTAASSQPAVVSNVLVYAENVGASTEWNCTNSGSPITCNSTSNPHAGSKDIEATSATTGNYAQLQKGSGSVALSSYSNLVFYIRSKAAWASKRSLQIGFYSSGTLAGSTVTLNDTMFGFSSSNTSSYQQIVVPLSLFAAGSTSVNQVRFVVGGSSGTIGFYLDDISLQGGVSQGSAFPGATPCGAWNSTATYATNCVVTYNYYQWVALAANTNSAPSSTNSNWQQYSFGPLRSFNFTIDGGGSVISTGDSGLYLTSAIACTINRWDIAADQSGSVSIDIWKRAGAIPTSSQKISASAPLALSSAQLAQNGSLTGWTTAVAIGDVFGFSVASATTVTRVTGQIWCQQ